jgi:hypothetical protein
VGEYFQIIADVEATEIEAAVLAETVVRWLVADGVIMPDTGDCVLGAEFGYPPGPCYTAATTGPSAHLRGLVTNGVAVSTGRQVFHPGQADLGPVICPRCDRTVVLEDPVTGELTGRWEPFSEALNTWYAGGSSKVRCPYCHAAVDFNDWRWDNEWPFAVGFLGFVFWNWPELNDRFIDQVAERLGHRLIVTGGKL